MLKFLKPRPQAAALAAPPAAPTRDVSWLTRLQQQAKAGGDAELIVDLSNVERINSRELGLLVRLHLELRHRDRRLVLGNAQGSVLEVLELTRMDRLMEVRPAEPHAS